MLTTCAHRAHDVQYTYSRPISLDQVTTKRSIKMENITISIETSNAAFVDTGVNYEVARILSELAARIKNDGMEAGDVIVLRDENGNKVGTASAS